MAVAVAKSPARSNSGAGRGARGRGQARGDQDCVPTGWWRAVAPSPCTPITLHPSPCTPITLYPVSLRPHLPASPAGGKPGPQAGGQG